MHLPPPDMFSTIILYVAAIIMAAKQAMSAVPGIPAKIPALKMGGKWNYVPAALLAVVFVIWIFRAVLPGPPLGAQAVNVSTIAAQGGKVYLPDSYAQKYLALVADGPTDPQKRAFLQPEIGWWIHLHGKLLSVDTIGDELYALVEPAPSARGYIGVFFSSQWSEQLSLIKRGETISFDALITADGNGPPKLAMAELR